MEASDLRLLNSVLYLGKETYITSITKGSEAVDYVSTRASGVITINSIQPIPITQDNIKRLGLKECYRSEFQVKYELESNPSIEYIFRLVDGNNVFRYYGFDTKCSFIHSLQNKIHSLTGKDLTLNQTP